MISEKELLKKIDSEKDVFVALEFAWKIFKYNLEINSLLERREICLKPIKFFEKSLTHGIALDAELAAKYLEVHKSATCSVNASSDLEYICEQYQEIVEADRLIERLYYKLSDTVKAAKAAGFDLYELHELNA